MNMNPDPLFGEGDYVEWKFNSMNFNSFLITGSEETSIYTELPNRELVKCNVSDDPFIGMAGDTLFSASGKGFVREWVEVNSEDDVLTISVRYSTSDYDIKYPNRFYLVATEINDSECESIWIPESNLAFAYPSNFEYPETLENTEWIDISANECPAPIFKLGSKVSWVSDRPALMRVPFKDGDGEEYAGYDEIPVSNIVGIISERQYRKYLPSIAYITGTRKASIKEGRFWNSHIPLNCNAGWVYKLDIQLYGIHGDFWVQEEDLKLAVMISRKYFDLAISPPISIEMFLKEVA